MYNLFVSANESAWRGQHHVFDRTRVFEFTRDDLRQKFRALTPEIIEELKSFPALFLYEAQVEQPGRLGRITDVQTRDTDVRVTFEIDRSAPALDHRLLPDLEWDLEIHSSELNRTHWALKNVDLGQALRRINQRVGTALASIPVARADLLDATRRLEQVGHSEFDRILLEFGIPELETLAGRDTGSRMVRANALARFALANPDSKTAEGRSLPIAIVEQANIYCPQNEFNSPGLKGSALSDAPARPENPAVAIDQSTSHKALIGTKMPQVMKQRVFIVHGRDEAAKHEVARFVEKLDLDAVILHEQANRGRSLVNKFHEVASDIHFAVVIMTPDDVGHLKGEPDEERARQNVVFELGFFIGKLGPDKVCALVGPTVRRPSDFEAVVYVPYAPASTWRTDLAREFAAAGIKFDAMKAIG